MSCQWVTLQSLFGFYNLLLSGVWSVGPNTSLQEKCDGGDGNSGGEDDHDDKWWWQFIKKKKVIPVFDNFGGILCRWYLLRVILCTSCTATHLNHHIQTVKCTSLSRVNNNTMMRIMLLNIISKFSVLSFNALTITHVLEKKFSYLCLFTFQCKVKRLLRLHACMCIHAGVHIHTYIHTYIHSYTHTSKLGSQLRRPGFMSQAELFDV